MKGPSGPTHPVLPAATCAGGISCGSGVCRRKQPAPAPWCTPWCLPPLDPRGRSWSCLKMRPPHLECRQREERRTGVMKGQHPTEGAPLLRTQTDVPLAHPWVQGRLHMGSWHQQCPRNTLSAGHSMACPDESCRHCRLCTTRSPTRRSSHYGNDNGEGDYWRE